MPQTPPRLPSEILRSVLRRAHWNGGIVLAVSGVLALASAFAGDLKGALAGLVIAGAGGLELHGARLLKMGNSRGTHWLVRSQLYLLTAVLGYVGWKLSPHEFTGMIQSLNEIMKRPEFQAVFAAGGSSVDELLQLAGTLYWIGLIAVAGLTTLHQGGMALYYYRRRRPVATAVAAMVGEG